MDLTLDDLVNNTRYRITVPNDHRSPYIGTVTIDVLEFAGRNEGPPLRYRTFVNIRDKNGNPVDNRGFGTIDNASFQGAVGGRRRHRRMTMNRRRKVRKTRTRR